jgi:hypothetical protein
LSLEIPSRICKGINRHNHFKNRKLFRCCRYHFNHTIQLALKASYNR